jgi:hypothetical protein
MRYFLDAEFNGFGGQLISLALVPEDQEASSFYEALQYHAPEAWVADHVLPVLQTRPISRPEMIADWPEDIAQLTLLMVTGPGWRMPLPRLRFKLLDLPFFDSETLSDVPHNACHDAMALRAYVLAEEQPWTKLPDPLEETIGYP